MLLSLVAGCKDDDDKDTPFGTYDRKALLTSLADKVIRPAYVNLEFTSARLDSAVAVFAQTPTAATLAGAQAEWKEVACAWKQAEVYAFGPAEVLNLEASVSYVADTMLVSDAADPTVTINQLYVEARPASAKGLWALEFLLFGGAPGTDAAVLARCTVGAGAAARRTYAAALATNLHAKASTVRDGWDAATYRQLFVAADGNDVTSSLSLLANALVQRIELIKNDRLGQPLGETTGGTPQPNAVEGYASGESTELLLCALDGLEAPLRGNRAGQSPAPGLDDLLDHLEGTPASGQAALSQRILAQLATTRQHTQALGTSLDAALAQQPATVRTIYDDTKQLTVLLKVEMISRLGVLLTFNDNDGD